MRRLCTCWHKGDVKVQLHTFVTSKLEGDGVIITTPRQLYLREDTELVLKRLGGPWGHFGICPHRDSFLGPWRVINTN
jgi:hypothetical protein